MFQPYRIKDQTISDTVRRNETPPRDRQASAVQVPSSTGINASPLVSLIGDTPSIPLTELTRAVAPGVALYVKLEGLNPGGSVKDRPALSIVRSALRDGDLAPSNTLLDATSGNTGIAYAMLGAALGFPVQLAIPADASPERLRILRAYGVELTLTDPADGTEGARRLVEELAAKNPDRFFYADQYNNPANPLAHYATTGPEIWRQTAGRITHFVAGLGTGGTMTGAGRYLKERNPDIQLVGVQPDSPKHGISGLKHLATADAPGNYDPNLLDQIVRVSTEDAHAMARELARRQGLFVGVSASAAVAAALQVGRSLSHGVVVSLLPDGGFKYASAPFWSE